jgi:hypothetical protein
VAEIAQREDTLLINPGAVFRANPHTVALLVLPERKATIVAL